MQALTLAHANAFFENQLDGLLKKLTPDMQPLWGSMTPQHMVEHLTWAIEGAMECWEANIITPEEKIPRVRSFLFTNYAIQPHFKHPNMPLDGELPALRLPSLEGAIAEFWQRWEEYGQYSKDNAEFVTDHVVFGPLNDTEWRLMHFKHVVHHLTQFGLTTLEEQGLEMPPAR